LYSLNKRIDYHSKPRKGGIIGEKSQFQIEDISEPDNIHKTPFHAKLP
jgi:hypothetical protein